MATQRARFFNSIGEDRVYQAEDFAQYFREMLSDGVFEGGEALQVTPSGDGMDVIVGFGSAYIRGYGYWLEDTGDGEMRLSLSASDDLPRIDLVVLRLDLRTEARTIELAVIEGEPAGSPVRPELTRTPNIWELALASVEVPANLTVVGARHITDLRFTDECGIVQSLMTIDVGGVKKQADEVFKDLQRMAKDFEAQMKEEVSKVLDQGYISHTQLTAFQSIYDAHVADQDHVPHIIADSGDDPDYIGVKYQLKMVNGEAYMEVVEA